mmetsp:Transcript_24825/g.29263  ORF Transcript_24825/g.29263 Transcript_24825/m.29263 type:complete len:110 (+) Transcript_24825:53-382(+)
MAGLFGGIGGNKKSPSDAGMARLAVNRIVRRDIMEMLSEPVQLALMRDLIEVCGTGLPSSTSSTDITYAGTGGETNTNWNVRIMRICVIVDQGRCILACEQGIESCQLY